MKQRLITGIVAGALFLGLCLLGGWPYQLLLTAMALIGYYEFVKMTGTATFGGTAVLGYASVVCFMIPWNLLGTSELLSWEQGIWLLMLLFLLVTVFSKNKLDIKITALMFTGIVYIGMGFSYMAIARGAEMDMGFSGRFCCCAASGEVMPERILSAEASDAISSGRRLVLTKLSKVPLAEY